MPQTLQRIQPKLVNTTLPGVMPGVHGGAMASYFKETASQSWVAGDLIYLDTNGTLAICTTSSNQLNSAIAGQALYSATGVTGTAVQFHPIRADEVYLMNVYHSTAASAVTAQTLLANNSGVGYAVIRASDGSASGNCWMVDIENTANLEDATHNLARVKIVGFELQTAIDSTGNQVVPALGDIYGLVKVQFLTFSIASDGTPFQRLLQLG